ncbi:MAG: PAS domain-containing protein [Gemmatimonadota bacterium]|nr:PAS domain-containing protein [Gemmatimonadota bacterium]
MTTSICLRCQAALAAGSNYCHSCGVSIIAAATGEYPIHDFERLFNYAIDLMCIAGTDGYFKIVNPAFKRVLGYTAQELLADPFVGLIHPDDRDATVAEVARLADGSPTLAFVNRYRSKSGGYVTLDWKAFPEPAARLIYATARVIPPRGP